jgi:probable rRNA maturation factor
MINIEVSIEPLPVKVDLIERAALAVLAQQSAIGDLTIVLTDDAQLQKLNRDYLGIDTPTDVLSFPATELDPETRTTYLGDVLVSVPRAGEQAQTAGLPVESELQLLVVHGVLHLLGYDHAKPRDKSKMWAAQAQVLESIGLAGMEILES